MFVILAGLSIGVLLAAPSDMSLRLSTHSGRVPLTLTVKGDVSRIPPETIATCHLRIDRAYTSPGGLTFNERTLVPCSGGPLFEQTLELKELGEYQIRIILKPKEGRELAGTTQEVTVYHRLEMGVQGSRTP
jgi:hypothetical protein